MTYRTGLAEKGEPLDTIHLELSQVTVNTIEDLRETIDTARGI